VTDLLAPSSRPSIESAGAAAADPTIRMVLDTSVRFIDEVYPLAKVRAGAYADEAQRADYLRSSAALGRTSPDGWLCAMISAEAPSSIARLTTSRG